MDSDTPKSLSTTTGTPVSMASRAAVEETVTRLRALSRLARMAPDANRTLSGSTRPAARRSAHRSAYGSSSWWVCCSPGSARTFTTAEPTGWTADSASRIASRSPRLGGTLAWAANTTSSPTAPPAPPPPRPAARRSWSRCRNGSPARATARPGARSVASRVNSVRSRRLCTTSRSQARRWVTALAEAGMLIPGSPVISTGRPRPRTAGRPASRATVGPVQASSRTSGGLRRSRRCSSVSESRRTGEPVAARACSGDGATGEPSSTCSRSQSGGRRSRVAALHFR